MMGVRGITLFAGLVATVASSSGASAQTGAFRAVNTQSSSSPGTFLRCDYTWERVLSYRRDIRKLEVDTEYIFFNEDGLLLYASDNVWRRPPDDAQRIITERVIEYSWHSPGTYFTYNKWHLDRVNGTLEKAYGERVYKCYPLNGDPLSGPRKF